MDYQKIYSSLVERARHRKLDCYCESHHVIPRCIGGSDDQSNLVDLTPEEHYLAHQLLTKIYPENRKLALAALMMTVKRPSNKLYGWLRRRHSQAMSDLQGGENNSQFGTVWIHDPKTLTAKKIRRNQEIPDGWSYGRSPKLVERTCECCFCKQMFTTTENTKFCSDKCLQHARSPAIYTIDRNIEEMIVAFSVCKSISKVLNTFGIPGRQGNAYFSSILKERGFDVLKRRNSKPC